MCIILFEEICYSIIMHVELHSANSKCVYLISEPTVRYFVAEIHHPINVYSKTKIVLKYFLLLSYKSILVVYVCPLVYVIVSLCTLYISKVQYSQQQAINRGNEYFDK